MSEQRVGYGWVVGRAEYERSRTEIPRTRRGTNRWDLGVDSGVALIFAGVLLFNDNEAKVIGGAGMLLILGSAYAQRYLPSNFKGRGFYKK